MALKKTPNVAQYKGADWSTLSKRVPNCTPASAQRIAMRDPTLRSSFTGLREVVPFTGFSITVIESLVPWFVS